MIRRILVALDIVWILMLPLIASAYFVYTNSAFSNQILIYGWIMFVIHVAINLALFDNKPNIYTLTLSLINSFVFIGLILFHLLEIRDYLIFSVMAECVSMVGAIAYFMLFKKGVNNQSAWKTIGPGVVILNLLLFSLTTYPYIREWIIMLGKTGVRGIFLYGTIAMVILGIRKKINAIAGFIGKTRKSGVKEVSDIIQVYPERLDNKTWPYLTALGLWFAALITLAIIR